LKSDAEFLERIKNLGLTECLRAHNRKLIPTFRNSKDRGVIHQIDHLLFVTRQLYDKLTSCVTGEQQLIFGRSLSDHLPIMADFRAHFFYSNVRFPPLIQRYALTVSIRQLSTVPMKTNQFMLQTTSCRTSVPPGCPDPMGKDAMYGLLGDIVSTIDPHTEADPAAVASQTLAAFGNVVERITMNLMDEEYQPYARAFCVPRNGREPHDRTRGAKEAATW
jgi:hypothetical protein